MQKLEPTEQRNNANNCMAIYLKYVLVTGATGFIGAHVVDVLWNRGLKVFYDAVKDVDAPFTYSTEDNKKELILPAINGIQHIVITSSFATVMNVNRKAPPYFTYTSEDWNLLTYEESIDSATSTNFVEQQTPNFGIVNLCPLMTFGSVDHPVAGVDKLNESNRMLWMVASGQPLPVARVPFWVDVRDLAETHVEGLLRPDAGSKRFVVASPQRSSYSLAADRGI
ncbi:NAD dependent epimerase/dehydratase [Rhexocercosporidium sp. MPI-PUGE-AT-0058]|nr:NAD dependent epimerase/dehydratase [Rhexocercosporidium sp. MPI-PUGE-AT-0058]